MQNSNISEKEVEDTMENIDTQQTDDMKKTKEALVYLRQWSKDKENWKFNKNKQSLLVRHVFDKKRISKSDFKILIAYLKESKGLTRTRLLEKVAEMLKKSESLAKDEKTIKSKIKRAKKLLKALKD